MRRRLHHAGILGALLAWTLSAPSGFARHPTPLSAPDLTGRYHFLHHGDRLGLLQEEGMLRGYISVLQGSDESDGIFTYRINIGSRRGDRVEFRTVKIHEEYYRFVGEVKRGSGRKKTDPDYLELQGELETIRVNDVTNTRTVKKQSVTFKSLGQDEPQYSP